MSWTNTDTFPQHHIFDRLCDRPRPAAPLSVAVCSPSNDIALEAAVRAASSGLIIPILVGPKDAVAGAAALAGLDIAPFERIDAHDDADAAEKSVDLCRLGKAGALMKGNLHTDVFLHAVLRSGSGLTTTRRISHVYVFDVPSYPRPLLISDAAVTIAPTLDHKADIVRNAIDCARVLAIEQPKIAILSAVETIDSRLPSTIDAAALCKMVDRGQITGTIIDGPLDYDTAVDVDAARIKGLTSTVAGKADILIVPDLESGNMLAKELQYLGNARAAGIVMGARVPIILTSRADSAEMRLASCALAVLANETRPAAVETETRSLPFSVHPSMTQACSTGAGPAGHL
jgi:phosphate acetyltransferase